MTPPRGACWSRCPVSARVFGGEVTGRWWRLRRPAARCAPPVYAHAPGRREIAKGEPVRDGWLRFQLSDADYRKLAATPDLGAIVTVDRQAGRILGVRFRGRR